MKLSTNKYTRYRLLIAGICTALFLSCDEETGLTIQESIDSEINDEVVLQSSYEDIDDLSMAGASHDFSSVGRYERDERFGCAELSREETETGVVITIDFGEGCEGPNGRVRAGMIRITKDGNHWEPGSLLITELIGFSIDNLSLEGTRSVKNISESIEAAPTFEITLTAGKATWEDGSIATREVNRIRTLYSANNPLGDEIHITGESEGVNRRGVDYKTLILEELVYLRACRAGRKFIPVSGVKQITKGEQVATIDFGDKTCDNLAMKTVDGVSKEITIKPGRGR